MSRAAHIESEAFAIPAQGLLSAGSVNKTLFAARGVGPHLPNGEARAGANLPGITERAAGNLVSLVEHVIHWRLQLYFVRRWRST